MSPVSPTLVPAASSSNRSVSPSKDVTGKFAAGVAVWSTTNSCLWAPWFTTSKATVPAEAEFALSLMNMCVGSVSPRATETTVAPAGRTQKSWCMPMR